ncbi:MAG: hypothetical protein GC181_09915 [Bacteroidetes bacterium]|nr:hypothetical protein [Bacteroidota bacterium]
MRLRTENLPQSRIFRWKILRLIPSFFFLFFGFSINRSKAQPANDNCTSAFEIVVPQSGMGRGNFTGQKAKIDSAGREIGEQCSDDITQFGNCNKTVWYKFSIATTRDANVILKQQDSSIPQIFAGFTIYRVDDCSYNTGNLSQQLIPITKFGESGNTCLQAGTYYVQVAARNNAKGILWVDLEIQNAPADKWNEYQTPLEIIQKTDIRADKYIDTRCLSIDSVELLNGLTTGYCKTFWVKMVFPSASVLNYLLAINYQTDFKYRVFRNQIDIDSVKSKKPFSLIARNKTGEIILEPCKGISNDTVYYVQFLLPVANTNMTLSTLTDFEIKDAWNTPDTDFEITTDNKYSAQIVKHFNCTSLLSEHRCKDVIPDYFVREFPQYSEIDTFLYGSYIIVHSKEKGQLSINLESRLRWDFYPVLYRIYKGDIRKNCDLVLHQECNNLHGGTFCLDTGYYTVLISRISHWYDASYVKLTIKQKAIPENIKGYHHQDAIQLGNLIPSDPVKRNISTETVHYHSIDTTVTFDTFSRTGRLEFFEFYLTEASALGVSESTNQSSYIYLFKGKISDNSIQFIDGQNYGYGYRNICTIHDVGYYTLISWYDTALFYDNDQCELPNVKVLISASGSCPIALKNWSPKASVKINNNQDLLSNSKNLKGINYVYNLDYCYECSSITPVSEKPAFACKRPFFTVFDTSSFFFYTFYIAKNCEVRLPKTAVLYKGDLNSNTNLCRDTLNIVDPCNPYGGQVFCNLESGYYTIVICNKDYGFQTNPTIVVTPHLPSPNDNAYNSYDFGEISQEKKDYISPAFPITCNTHFHTTDPCYRRYGSYQIWCPTSVYKKFPFPDTLNRSRNLDRKNLWYTFVVEGASNLTISVKGTDFCQERMSVFKYLGDADLPFSWFRDAGFDSTSNSLKEIAYNGDESYTTCCKKYMTFQNEGCGKTRYFVLLDAIDDVPSEYTMYVNKTNIPLPNAPGDQCSDPATLNIKSNGSYTSTTKNHCHTYGGSPFENLDNPDLKTTWFKISVSDLKKFDMAIRYTGNVQFTGFSIYAGDCGALTKVIDLFDQTSYFTLSCMGAGNYYIQIITESRLSGDLSFKIDINSVENPNCKPYDYAVPLSGFNQSGGCNNDTVRFTNISSIGDDIRYYWHLNGAQFSTSKDLEFIRPDKDLKDSNRIQLIVRNNKSGMADTSEFLYVNDTTSYYIKITDPGSVRCSDTFAGTYTTNYPHRLNNFWIPTGLSKNPYDEKQVYTQFTYGKIILTATSENCILKDTQNVQYDNTSGLLPDTLLICNGTDHNEIDLSYATAIVVNGVQFKGTVVKFNTPGKYNIRFAYNGCYFSDSVTVSRGGDVEYDTLQNTITKCIYDPVILKTNEKYNTYRWSDQTTKESIEVLNPGTYELLAERNTCSFDVHYFKVENDSALKPVLVSDTFCFGDWFTYPKLSDGINWKKRSPDADSFAVLTKTDLFVVLKDSICEITDSSTLFVVNHKNQIKDTSVCFENIPSIWLDAGDALQYDWTGQHYFERQFETNAYGKYISVRTLNDGCSDTIHFEIKEDCPLKIFIPTAFSPNTDEHNPVFKPIIYGRYEWYELTIFNRWGEVILKDVREGVWDGTYQNEIVQTGIYTAIVRIKTKDQAPQMFVETISVLR